MNVQLNTPQHISTLRDCAMQANLEVRMWLGTVQDDQLSDEVTESKQAERGSAKVVKNLLASCNEHSMVKRYRSFAYNWFKQTTYPYAGSYGLLPNYEAPKVWTQFEDEIKPGYGNVVGPFLLAYADLRSNYAFKMQGQMYNAADYPSVDEVRDKFSINLFIQPVPHSDFSQKITAEIADQLNTHYAKQAERFIRETGERQLAQLAKVMQSISHCCEIDVKETADGETKITRRRLHESTLERAIEYCDVFKHFNPSGDARLEGIRADLEQVLRGINIKALRESDSLRATVKSDVDDIMKKFGL